MKVSISIMAHNSREYIKSYSKEIGDVPIAMDDGRYGLIENCKRAWKLYDPNSDYHLVLQDDLILTSNFLEKVKHHLKKGHNVYHFFLGNRNRFKPHFEEAKKNKQDHILLNNVHSAQAICIKTSLIEDMLKHFDTEDSPIDDERINQWIRKNGFKVYFSLPCLVEHLNKESLHNFNKSKMDTRKAIWFKQ